LQSGGEPSTFLREAKDKSREGEKEVGLPLVGRFEGLRDFVVCLGEADACAGGSWGYRSC
jgi:hypothetical protein